MAIANAASAKKALDIVIIDIRKMPSVCDYFVLASGASTTQVNAIADNIKNELRKKGERPWHVEGEREALWVVLDYGGVVAHIFYEETRRFYNLEHLWSDAPQGSFKEKKGKKPKHGLKKKKRVRKASSR